MNGLFTAGNSYLILVQSWFRPRFLVQPYSEVDYTSGVLGGFLPDLTWYTHEL